MNLKFFLNEFLNENYCSIVLSTTSNQQNNFIRLPDKIINEKKCMSFSVKDKNIAIKIIQLFDEYSQYFYIDVERKQQIDLFQISKDVVNHAIIREIKPNDLAMEATDILIQKMAKDKSKKILIIGSGNIAFKVALRLAERNFKVYLCGRNKKKINIQISALNSILPNFSEKIDLWDGENIDILCSFLSAKGIINSNYIKYLSKNAIAIDGGIGNFSEDFIHTAINKKIFLLRLDVRISNGILDGYDRTMESDFFNKIMGEKYIDNLHLVSGGIIGGDGDIIVDTINNPRNIIGIANGFGGVKNFHELTTKEKNKIKKILDMYPEIKSLNYQVDLI